MDNPSIKKQKIQMSKSCKALLTLLGKDEKKAEIELGKCDVKSLKTEDQQKVLDFHKKLFCSRFTIDTDTDKQSYCKVTIDSKIGNDTKGPMIGSDVKPTAPIVPVVPKDQKGSTKKPILEALPEIIPQFSDTGASSGGMGRIDPIGY